MKDRLDLQDHVLILGERDDIPDLLEASDLFLLASYAEGMPLCISEALAKGVPVVASAVDGIPEQVDGSCGVLLPPPSENEEACIVAIAETLDRLNSRRDVLPVMASAANERARRLFAPEIMLNKYRTLINEILVQKTAIPQIQAIGRSTSQVRELKDAGAISAIDFTRPLQVWRHLGEGWSVSEPDGIWTEGELSTLRMRLRGESSGVRLVFRLRPLITAAWKAYATDVYVNGKLTACWRFRDGGAQKATVDFTAPECETEIELRFVHHHAKSLTELGIGDDPRRLSLFFSRVEVLEKGFLGTPLGSRVRSLMKTLPRAVASAANA